MKKQIEQIIKKNIVSVNSFVDDKGKNNFGKTVDELGVLFNNRIWEIAADMLKSIGVKKIHTTYKK